VVNGVLLSRRFQGIKGSAGLASLGDGATSTGAFHEALNQAAVEQLPLVVVVANNQYAYSTPNQRQFACKSLLDRGQGYGVQPWAVDGTSLVACLDVLGRAVDCARRNESSQLVVASLLRLCGHGEHDDASYIDPAVRSSPVSRDCLQVAEHELLQNGWASAGDFPNWRQAAVGEVEASVEQVQHEPAPDLDQEEWCALSARHLVEGQGN
jgi:pyruvate dehydrogenase E1 component alpha subunit/2-oxoisovalerate dehydrogenase E1 component alpha subunit